MRENVKRKNIAIAINVKGWIFLLTFFNRGGNIEKQTVDKSIIKIPNDLFIKEIISEV
jgi:hypothetical protein